MNAISFVLIACALMLVYIWFRFELHFGVTAVVALLLDVGVMISMVTILRLQVNSSFIAAVLTIVGYAINDTIVIFDRIRENMRLHSRKEMTRAELADLSVKETLPRTVNTSITTLLTIVMLYIMGVTSIREFALPIIIGLLAGIYTSVFIAPSLWGVWQDKTDLKKAAAAQEPRARQRPREAWERGRPKRSGNKTSHRAAIGLPKDLPRAALCFFEKIPGGEKDVLEFRRPAPELDGKRRFCSACCAVGLPLPRSTARNLTM